MKFDLEFYFNLFGTGMLYMFPFALASIFAIQYYMEGKLKDRRLLIVPIVGTVFFMLVTFIALTGMIWVEK